MSSSNVTTLPDTQYYSYSIYGLNISTIFPLEGPQPTKQLGTVDIVIDEIPFEIRQDIKENRPPNLENLESPQFWETSNGHLCLKYQNGPLFIFSPGGDRIWVDEHVDTSAGELSLYLLGSVLGFALRLKGILCFHASAFQLNHSAIAVAGPSGAGKSTIAALLASQGYTILTDDILAIKEETDTPHAYPGYPRLRLWPDSTKQLHGNAEALARLIPDWDKRYLDLNRSGFQFASKPLPLAAIYILAPRESAIQPQIKNITGTERSLSLIRNTYRNELLSTSMRAHEFQSINRIVDKILIRQVISSDKLANIDRLCKAIIQDASDVIND